MREVFDLLFGIEEVLVFQNAVQFAKRLEDLRLAVEVQVFGGGEQVLVNELMRGAAAECDHGVAVMHHLFGGGVECVGEPGVTKRGERIGRDGGHIAFANYNQRRHGCCFLFLGNL